MPKFNIITTSTCKIVLLLALVSFCNPVLWAQKNEKSDDDQIENQNESELDSDFKRYKELFTFHPNKKKAAKDSTLYASKFIVAPIVSFSPETSLALGAGAKYLFKFRGSGDETRTSNMPMSLRYTLNNQFILFSGFEIFTNQEKWVITGNIRFQNFPQLYYGIGRDTPKSNEEQYDFVQALFEPIVLKQVLVKHLFVGGGLRYNHIFNTELEENGLLETERPAGYNGSTSAGAEFAVLYDSRNNILNANNGWFLEFTHGFYGTALGGTQSFQLTRFDLRHFISLGKNKNSYSDILGFQFVGHFSNGNVPINELAAFGGDKILRGYRKGRYLERHLLATQVEYRKKFKNSRWGAVAFLGTGGVTDDVSKFSLGNFRPNFGVGVRFLLDKDENLNVRLDWGVGDEKSNIYLNLSEAF